MTNLFQAQVRRPFTDQDQGKPRAYVGLVLEVQEDHVVLLVLDSPLVLRFRRLATIAQAALVGPPFPTSKA